MIVDIDVNVEMMSLVVYGTLIIENRPDIRVNLRAVCINLRCASNITGPSNGYCGRIIAGSPEEPFEGQLGFYPKGDHMTITNIKEGDLAADK